MVMTASLSKVKKSLIWTPEMGEFYDMYKIPQVVKINVC